MEVFMTVRSKAETERFYRRLLTEQVRSGLSLRAFAAVRGVPAGTLSSWKHQLKKRDAEARASRRSPPRATPPGPTFVPVSVIASTPVEAEQGPPQLPTPAVYEVLLGAGRALRVPHDFDEQRVAALVRAVVSC
jgi:hypothetical protein